MTARLLDGTALSAKLRTRLAARVRALVDVDRPPGLTVVLVGDDPASRIYVRNKIRACADIGIRSDLRELPASASEPEVLSLIASLDADPAVDGILVQMPLPRQIDPARVIESIGLDKDVDGFHLASDGALMTGATGGFRPCTPYGVMRLLDDGGVPIAGSHAVVVGRSNTVGKPMAMMLLAANATVTVCHSATRDLGSMTRQADIVVAAVGRAGTLTADMVKPGAAVIDVGMNRDGSGKLVGDVDFASVAPIAGWITPVPGGVGPMTITMLLHNTVLSTERRLSRTGSPMDSTCA